jgi:hypothetical protein
MPPPAAPRWRSPSPARPCRRARDGATLGRRSFRRRLLLSAWCGGVGSALSARGCRRGRVLSGGGRRRAALAAPLPAAPHWRSLSSAKPRRRIRDGVALGRRCSWRRLALSAWCGLVGGTPSLRVAVGAKASSQLKRARDIRTVARFRSPLAPAQPQYANAPRRSGPLSPPPPCARFRLARRPRRPCATHGARNTSRATLRTQHIVRLAPHTHTPDRTARRAAHHARNTLRAVCFARRPYRNVARRLLITCAHAQPEAPDAPRRSGLPARRRLAFASGSCVDRTGPPSPRVRFRLVRRPHRAARNTPHTAHCAPSSHTRTHSARQAPHHSARQAPRQPGRPRRAATRRAPRPASASHSLPALAPTAPHGAQRAARATHCAPSARDRPHRNVARRLLLTRAHTQPERPAGRGAVSPQAPPPRTRLQLARLPQRTVRNRCAPRLARGTHPHARAPRRANAP